MPSATATVSTQNASRYLQQLCKHWSHRFNVTFDPHTGGIDFGGGQLVELSATDRELKATVHDEAASGLAELQEVVAEHLLRFAFRESLEFNWTPIP